MSPLGDANDMVYDFIITFGKAGTLHAEDCILKYLVLKNSCLLC